MTARRLPSGDFDVEQLTPGVRRPIKLRPWLIFAGVVVVAFFGLIFSRVSLDRSGFELDDLEEQIAIEEARRGDLRVEVARLQDPNRINAIAAEIGLVYPTVRIEIEVPGLDVEGIDPEFRWAQLKAVLTAQP
ncbi:MAG: hypothetical protein GY720_12840 [bacterium]|nr:hypothetical protein [bacterium]